MASFAAKKVAKQVLKEHAQNDGIDDPYFEHIAAVDLSGRPTGKYTKRKRAIPPGLTKQEEKVLKKVTRRAYRLDNCLNFCGIRVGWSAVIGLLPAIGDIVDALMAFMVVMTATQAEIPPTLKSRMVFNILMDFMVGLVPFIGDIADAFYRCNTRNAALLWEHLRARGAARVEEGEKVESMPRSSTQRLRNESPGRSSKEAQPQASRKYPHRSQEQHIQAGRRGEAKISGQPGRTSRTHSSRRENNCLSSQQFTGRFVTTGDIDNASKSKAANEQLDGLMAQSPKRSGEACSVNADVEHDAEQTGRRKR